jgi:hypothetical protein
MTTAIDLVAAFASAARWAGPWAYVTAGMVPVMGIGAATAETAKAVGRARRRQRAQRELERELAELTDEHLATVLAGWRSL